MAKAISFKGLLVIALREYQADAFSKVMRGFESGLPSQLIVLPTGTGKTVLFGAVAATVVENGGRALVLAHREELIEQAANTMAIWGLSPAIEKADDHAMPRFTRSPRTPMAHMEDLFGNDVNPETDPKCVVGSVQTFQGHRLKAWPPGWFDLVICDEAHHAAAESYRRSIQHLNPKWYLGVTATWDRGDKTPIVGPSQVFAELAYEYSFVDAVDQGFLARPTLEMLHTSVALDEIRTTAGDLNAGDLEKAIAPAVEELVNAALPFIRERSAAIVFTPDVGSAEAVASAFAGIVDANGRPCGVSAASVSGMDPDRDRIIAEFRTGRYKVLCNCALLTEGFDAPFVDTIVLMRPTKSRALMVQMVGRGTRIFPGKKECLVLGYDWKTLRHKLVHPVEIYNGPGLDPVDIDVAKSIVRDGQKDLLMAIRTAEVVRQERQKLCVKVKERKKAAKSTPIDPLKRDWLETATPSSDPISDVFQRPATDKQIAMLLRFGFKEKEVAGWNSRRAGATLDVMIGRARAGLATKKQVDLLRRCGYVDAANLKVGEASALIDQIAANGWRLPASSRAL